MMTESDANEMAAQKNYELWKQEEEWRAAAEAELMVAKAKLRRIAVLAQESSAVHVNQLRGVVVRIEAIAKS